MSIPKGGRGKKAEYRTVPVRCPEPLKLTVQEIIRRYHAQEFQPSDLEAECERLKARLAELEKTPAAMSEAQILASMSELSEEYLKRIPKSTAAQADEICDQIIEEMAKAGFTPNMQVVFVSRIVEEFSRYQL